MATYVDLATLFTPVPRAIVPSTWASQIREDLTFLHDNRRVICTSSTRPTGFEGLEIYETDTDKTLVYDGTNWATTARLATAATYTPTLTQTSAVSKTVNVANYWKIGRIVTVQVHLTCTGAGGGNTQITISTPDTMTYSGSPSIAIGSGGVFDASGAVFRVGMVVPVSTTTVAIWVDNAVNTIANATAPTFTLANTDQVTAQWSYVSTTVT